jgi:hypothetical protein
MRRVPLALLWLAACAAPVAPGPVRIELRGPAWVGDPAAGWDAAATPLVVRVTGSARVAPGDPERGSREARAAATEALEHFAHAAVSRLQATVTERLAPLVLPERRAILNLDPARVQRLGAQALAAARPLGEWADDQSHYAWLELDAGAALLPAFEADLAVRLRELSREATAADRAALREALASAAAAQHRR